MITRNLKFTPKRKASLLGLLACVIMPLNPAIVQAQEVQNNAGQSSAVEPERMEAAREVMMLYFPEENREKTLQEMIDPIFDTMTGSLMQDATLSDALDTNPKMRKVFDDFIASERVATMDLLNQNFPMLINAMSTAYARNMTTGQLVELRDYLKTDSGQSFIAVSTTIFSDPDVQSTQQQIMAQSFKAMPAKMDKFMEDIRAALEGN